MPIGRKDGLTETMRFAILRPWLILRDLLVNRDRPDLEGLARIRDPERFVWTILPHAARTFSTCIALLPTRAAKAAAVAYLYCRILDTYEDLSPDPVSCREALRRFAARFDSEPPAPPPALDASRARDARDRSHLLLVSRYDLVDRVHLSLPAAVRGLVGDLVRDMAKGMAWSSEAFAAQGGVLKDEEQVARYCQAVIGNPVLFTIRLIRWLRTGETGLPPGLRREAMRVGEMVQLANITRDIEKDLGRGIAYHPILAPDVGRRADGDPARLDRIRRARRDLLRMALLRAPSYRALLTAMDGPRVTLARASALLMLLYTDRHYRSCARRSEVRPWAGRTGGISLVLNALPALWSRRWGERVVTRVERNFLRAARGARSAEAWTS